jgi:hypothetical protein
LKIRDFTFEEDKLLLTTTKSLDEISKELNREKYAVSRRIRNLSKQRYTIERLEKEEEFIKEVYHYLSIRDIERYLEISYQSVRSKIRSLNNQSKLNNKIEFKYKKTDDDYILENRDKLSLSKMANHLGYSEGKTAVRLEQLKKIKPQKKIEKRVHLNPMTRKMVGQIPPGAITVEEIEEKLNLIEGKVYEIYTPKTGEEKLDNYFKGEFIQETDNLITLKGKRYCQSFSKKDIRTGKCRVKEVK